MDDFLLRAGLAGVLVAAAAGPLGCFVVWRRMSYFGDTLAHSALLGAAAAIALDIDSTIAVFGVAVTVAGLLTLLERQGHLAADTLLGLLSHGALAISLVVIAFLSGLRLDLLGYLFGDILAVSGREVLIIAGGAAAVLTALACIWRPLLAATVCPDIAAAEGLRPERTRVLFMLMLAALIAIAMKVVGALLITALLIIPAAAARRMAASPEAMALFAGLIGAASVVGGLALAVRADTPAGPSIVVAALAVFVLSQLWGMTGHQRMRGQNG